MKLSDCIASDKMQALCHKNGLYIYERSCPLFGFETLVIFVILLAHDTYHISNKLRLNGLMNKKTDAFKCTDFSAEIHDWMHAFNVHLNEFIERAHIKIKSTDIYV